MRGDERLTGLETSEGFIEADGLFIIRETLPVSVLLENISMQDKYIKVDRRMATSVPGVYAAGDCTGAPFQIAKAVGEGQVAALSAAKYIYSKKKET